MGKRKKKVITQMHRPEGTKTCLIVPTILYKNDQGHEMKQRMYTNGIPS